MPDVKESNKGSEVLRIEPEVPAARPVAIEPEIAAEPVIEPEAKMEPVVKSAPPVKKSLEPSSSQRSL